MQAFIPTLSDPTFFHKTIHLDFYTNKLREGGAKIEELQNPNSTQLTQSPQNDLLPTPPQPPTPPPIEDEEYEFIYEITSNDFDLEEEEEQPTIEQNFTINGTEYRVTSDNESIKNLSTNETYPTLQPLLQHLAPDLYASYTFHGDFPADFYKLGDATRVRIIRRLQHLHNPPPCTPLVKELLPLIMWIAEKSKNSQTVSRSYWRALYGTNNDPVAATALILYYGIFAAHNSHGKAIPGFNFHTIDETPSSIIVQTHAAKLAPRFENVQEIALNELHRYNRVNRHKPSELIKKQAFRAFYSGGLNGGLWITQTQEIHQYLQKLIQDIIKNPLAPLPDYEPPLFDDLITITIPKAPLEKRKYYRPSNYEDTPLEPGRIYTNLELQDLGLIKQIISKAVKKGFLLHVSRGKYMLNPDFRKEK